MPRRLPDVEIPGTRESKWAVDSQCMSFSADSSRLAIATRSQSTGDVFTAVYDFEDSGVHGYQIKTIPMPTVRLPEGPLLLP